MPHSRRRAFSTPAESPYTGQIQADLADHLQAGMRLRATGHVLVAGVIVLLLSGIQPFATLLAWLGVMLLLVVGAVAWLQSAHRAGPQRSAADARLRGFVWVEGAIGLAWLAGEVLLLPDIDLPHRATMFVFLNLWSAALMQSLSAHPPALYAAWLPVLAGVVFVTCYRPGPYATLAVTVLSLWFVIILKFTGRLHRTLVESLHLRHHADALSAALQLEKDRALALSLSRSRFLAAASHDLRQPVHALMLFVAALRHQPPADESRQLLGHVGDTLRSMERMFNGLLDMSRLDAGMARPVACAIDLHELLAPVVAEESTVARARGVGFVFTADAGLPPVESDPLMLERIVRNLVSNAVRYTHRGEIRVQVRQRPRGIDIRIADSGTGIAPEHRQAVFHEFFQVHAHAGRRNEGLGLGLAIVRRLCDLLGHRLTLRSRLGRGSVFTLRLAPARGLPAPQPQPIETTTRGLALAPAAGVVVIVDELAVTRMALHTLFTGWGHRVLALGGLGGQADLEAALASLDSVPGVIVCDSGPGGTADGIATIERLRMEFNEDIPALLLIDPARQDLQNLQGLQVPGVAVMAKPVNEQALRAALGAALRSPDS